MLNFGNPGLAKRGGRSIIAPLSRRCGIISRRVAKDGAGVAQG
jgi:hypothetical protein